MGMTPFVHLRKPGILELIISRTYLVLRLALLHGFAFIANDNTI
jgi:hypothetical protein